MRNLRNQLDLIREGCVYTGELLQLEADVTAIETGLVIECGVIETLSHLTVLEADMGAFIEHAKARLKMIIDAIVEMFITFIRRMKLVMTNVRQRLADKRKKKSENKPEVPKGDANTDSSEPKASTRPKVVPKDKPAEEHPAALFMPCNLLNPKNGFTISALKKLSDEVAEMSKSAKDKIATLPKNERRSWAIHTMLISKLFGDPGIALTSVDDYMDFIYGEKKSITLKSLNADKIFAEVDKIDADLAELQECVTKIKSSLNSIVPASYTKTETNISPVIEYQIKLYTELSSIASRVLSVYGKRCSFLTKLSFDLLGDSLND